MEIYIIRHGQTAKNKDMRLQGRSDDALNEAGIAQAEKAGALFKEQGIVFDRVYSSPLVRAVKTAQLAAPGAEIIPDERLLEMDYGPYEGASLKELSPELLYFFSDLVNHPAPEGMESLDAVVKRLGGFLEEIASETDGKILIATHAIAMKGALEYLTPESHGSYWAKNIGNCAIYKAEYHDGVFTVPYEVDAGKMN